MLDVHPPHHAAGTWRDFFIHIATIVVGLLIAVGLEQVVERLHQRYELRETREALQRELEANRKDIAEDVSQWRWEMAELENNLIVLRFIKQHPGTSQSALPGVLEWEQSPVNYESAVWDAAEKNGIARRMSPEEANRFRAINLVLTTVAKQGLDDWDCFNDAGRYRSFDGDPTHMTPAEVDRTLQALEVNMEKHLQIGDTYALMHVRYPELASPLTFKEVLHFQHYPRPEDYAATETAFKLTQARLNASTAPQ